MRVLIAYYSKTGNTAKISAAIEAGIESTGNGAYAQDIEGVEDLDLSKYDFVGFGSGVYFARPAKEMTDLLKRLKGEGKKAFIFETAGLPAKALLSVFRKSVEERGFDVVGGFICKGLDNFGPLKLIGGINKGHPDKKDLKDAEDFGKRMVSKIM